MITGTSGADEPPGGSVPPAPGVAPTPPPRARGGALRGRLLRAGLLAAAVATVVAFDTGAVPLPLSTPSGTPGGRVAAGGQEPGSASSPDVVGAATARSQGIGATLAAMTAAYAAKDEAGFLAAVDPGQSALVGRMKRVYRNLRTIGYSGVTFGWPVGDSATAPADVSNDGADLARPVVAAVEVRTQLEGFDPRPTTTILPWTFAERGGSWKLVGDRDAGADSFVGYYLDGEPWMVASVVVERRRHVVVIGEKSRAADVDRLATRLETAVGVVRDVWDVKTWNGKVVAYAMTNKKFVDYHFAGRAATGRKTKEAVFDAKVSMLDATPVRNGHEVQDYSAPRIVVTPFLLGRDTTESRAVLRHELTHVAFAFEGGESVPAWLVEGTAEYTGFRTGGASVDGVGALARRGLPRETWTQLRRGTWKPALVSDDAQFYDGTSARVGNTYTTAWLTCLYIADTYGEQSLAKMYAEAAKASPDGDPAAVEATVIKKVLKTDRTALLKKVRSYAQRIRSRFV